MADKVRGFIGTLLPGKRDGLFALIVLFCVSLCCSAWIPAFLSSRPALVVLALIASIACVLICSAHFNVWFALSKRF